MRLSELREEKNLTQNDIANAINTSRTNIGRWEKGLNEPSASHIIKLADFFECSADYLLGREDDFGNIAVSPTSTQLLNHEQALLDNFRKLPEDLQYRASAYMENLVKLGVSEQQSNFTHKNYSYKKTVNK